MSAIKTETMLMIGGAAVVGLLAWNILPKLAKGAGGLVSGNNALTQNQHNADGTPQTAYVGAGIPGTLGAAANTASGGFLSSFGDWIGSGLFNLTDHNDYTSAPSAPPKAIAPPSTPAAVDKYLQGGNAPSGSGSVDPFTLSDLPGFGFNYGN